MIRPSDLGFPAKFANFRAYPGYSQWQTASDMALAASESGFRFIGNCSPVGSGKCHRRGTKVLMFDGSIIAVELVKKGDFLMGPDSAPRRVLEIHSGIEQLLEIKPTKGDPWQVTSNHVLTVVRTNNKDNQEGGKISDIPIPEFRKLPVSVQRDLKLFRVSVEFPESNNRESFFPPYILGLFLGDGNLSHHSWGVCKSDPEIVQAMRDFAESINCSLSLGKNGNYLMIIAKQKGDFHKGKKNPVRSALERLGLFTIPCNSKFVPRSYKIGSRRDRLEILAGLLDTDGSLSGPNGFDFISKSQMLADDVAFLARSLGLAAYVRECTKRCQNEFEGQYFRVSISGDCSSIPTRIPRKQAQPRVQKKSVLRTGFTVSDWGIDEYFGFSVDGDHRYLLGDFTVCHNSLSNLTASRILDTGRTLYLTVNKSLQNQLMSDFGDSATSLGMFNLTGHSSYPCAVRSQHSDTGAISSIECTDRENCGYWRDVRESLTRDFVTSNFANWISIARAGDQDRFGHFSTLVLDEAHNLESVLCDLLAVRFSRRTTYELIKRNLPQAGEPLFVWIEWAKSCLPVALQALGDSRQRDRDESNGRESIDTKRLAQLSRDISTVSYIADEWAIEPKPYGAQLTPAFAENYAEDYLFRGIPTVILSSATITAEDFAYLGIQTPDFKLFDIQSGFPPERRPFYYWPKTSIDYSSVEGQFIQTINRYDQIIEPRLELGWRVLIHSVSYDHAQTIANLSRHPVLTHTKSNAQSVIRDWMSDPRPQILASPIMSEGVDLAHDLCRCQFQWKVPIKYSGDPLISIRKKRRPKYTLYLAAKTIQQVYGRVMRAGSDYGETWITDTNWGRYMRRSVNWPVSFRSAWKTIDRLPDPLKF